MIDSQTSRPERRSFSAAKLAATALALVACEPMNCFPDFLRPLDLG